MKATALPYDPDDVRARAHEVREAAWAIVKASRQLKQHPRVVRWARAHLGLSDAARRAAK